MDLLLVAAQASRSIRARDRAGARPTAVAQSTSSFGAASGFALAWPSPAETSATSVAWPLPA